jgi:hypothetical protein
MNKCETEIRRTARGSDSIELPIRKSTTRSVVLFLIGEADDAMSELFAIYSISSDVGMFIGLSSKVRISLI